MKRRLFNLAAAVSLMLMFATTLLLVRTLWARDYIILKETPQFTYIFVTDLCMARFVQSDTDKLNRLGHGFGYGPGKNLDVAIPLPPLIPPLLLAPVLWLHFNVQARRRDKQLCIACGYDLRATPDRCPECGMAVAPKPAEAAA